MAKIIEHDRKKRSVLKHRRNELTCVVFFSEMYSLKVAP